MRPATEFCSVCQHLVYNLAKHEQTEEHKRQMRRFESNRLLRCSICGVDVDNWEAHFQAEQHQRNLRLGVVK